MTLIKIFVISTKAQRNGEIFEFGFFMYKDFSASLPLTDQTKVVVSTEAQRNEEIFEFDFFTYKDFSTAVEMTI